MLLKIRSNFKIQQIALVTMLGWGLLQQRLRLHGSLFKYKCAFVSSPASGNPVVDIPEALMQTF
jgi:hypothetical protein